MSVQIVLDVTNEYTTGLESGTPKKVKLDIGGFDYAVIQAPGASNDIAISSTNDSGDIQGVSDGSAVSSTNYVAIQGVDLTSGTLVGNIGDNQLVRVQSVGRYLLLDGTADSVTVTKLLVRLYKIH
jgi:hypothetical protein